MESDQVRPAGKSWNKAGGGKGDGRGPAGAAAAALFGRRRRVDGRQPPVRQRRCGPVAAVPTRAPGRGRETSARRAGLLLFLSGLASSILTFAPFSVLPFNFFLNFCASIAGNSTYPKPRSGNVSTVWKEIFVACGLREAGT